MVREQSGGSHPMRLVIGCRLRLVDAPDVLAWCATRGGYAALCRLLTLGKRRAAKGGVPVVARGPAGRPRRAARRGRPRRPRPGGPGGLPAALARGDGRPALARRVEPPPRRRRPSAGAAGRPVAALGRPAAGDERRRLPRPRPAPAAGRADVRPPRPDRPRRRPPAVPERRAPPQAARRDARPVRRSPSGDPARAGGGGAVHVLARRAEVPVPRRAGARPATPTAIAHLAETSPAPGRPGATPAGFPSRSRNASPTSCA